jgi:metal-dependent amidase/aminoacylase/carboxypeptidase family protein
VQNAEGTRNTVDAACEFNVLVKGIKSQFSPLKPLLIANNKIKSNNFDFDASNIVADTTWTTMIFRTFDQTLADQVKEKLLLYAKNVAENNGCTVQYDDKIFSKTVKNDPELTQWSNAQLTTLLGKERIKAAKPRLGGDDFSFLTHFVPAVYLRIGTGGKPEFEYELHDKRFQVNPEALDTGVAALAYLVFKKASL